MIDFINTFLKCLFYSCQIIKVFHFQGNNIFGNLTAEEYNRVMKMLENAILATDLALYFRLVSLHIHSVTA